jgi:hypothetical protein
LPIGAVNCVQTLKVVLAFTVPTANHELCHADAVTHH